MNRDSSSIISCVLNMKSFMYAFWSNLGLDRTHAISLQIDSLTLTRACENGCDKRLSYVKTQQTDTYCSILVWL